MNQKKSYLKNSFTVLTKNLAEMMNKVQKQKEQSIFDFLLQQLL